jgi:glycosyltransferase involved in cell wall biosynthesis
MARQTAEVFPFATQKITHVHNGLTLSDLPADPGVPPIDSPFLLMVARQVSKKATDTLLHAFALLERQFPELRLVVVGGGPMLEDNRRLAHRLGVASRTLFVGDIPHADALRYFATCSVVVVPSRAEPFGLVVLEGAYYKKPMVCTRVGGIPEIVSDGVSAFLVDRDDHVAMADRIAALLCDPQVADSLGAQAYRTLMRNFRSEDRVKDYIAVYERADGGVTRPISRSSPAA